MASVKSILAKFLSVALIANEVRGFVIAAPVMLMLLHRGGTLMAIWLVFYSMVSIIISVIVSIIVAKRMARRA